MSACQRNAQYSVKDFRVQIRSYLLDGLDFESLCYRRIMSAQIRNTVLESSSLGDQIRLMRRFQPACVRSFRRARAASWEVRRRRVSSTWTHLRSAIGGKGTSPVLQDSLAEKTEWTTSKQKH